MADVVTTMYPDAKLAIGPPTEDGFYYDFLVENPFSEEDIKRIERQMKKIIGRNLSFEYSEYSREEILEKNKQEPLKLEVISEIPEGEKITTYKHGDFEDLCAGPHVDSTGQIPAFKLINVAKTYWKNDENRPMLQRIYGTAWESKESLEKHLNNLEEAKKRDHRTLGKEMDLFSIHEETGPGLIINAAVIGYLYTGGFEREVAFFVLISLLPAVFGFLIASQLANKSSEEVYKKALLVVIILSGIVAFLSQAASFLNI